MVAVVMGIGAVFAALNTMYSAVAERSREVATLRALGFPGSTIVAFIHRSRPCSWREWAACWAPWP